MAVPKDWVEIWDEDGTSRKVDPATAKSLLVSSRFSDKPPKGSETVTEVQPALATGKPAVATTAPEPASTSPQAQGS